MRASDFVLSLALGLTLVAPVGCTGNRQAEPRAVERLDETTLRLSSDAMKNLKIARADNGEFPDQLAIMGRISVTEDRTAVVPARVGGRIEAVYVASGEVVAKGQQLALLFSPDYVIAREEYLQAVKEGGDLIGMSKNKLVNMGMSREDIDKIAAPANKESSNMLIRAPRAGALLTKNATIGNAVNIGDTLFTLGDLSKVWFAGDIYPEDLPKVHKNQDIVIDSAAGGPPILGKVSFISPVIDPTSRTIKIRALMENPGGYLRGDMYVQGKITLSKRQALVIPTTAIIRLNDTNFCFARTGPDTFKKVPIEVGKEQGGVAMVLKGLTTGTDVVSEGGLLLDAALTAEKKD